MAEQETDYKQVDWDGGSIIIVLIFLAVALFPLFGIHKRYDMVQNGREVYGYYSRKSSKYVTSGGQHGISSRRVYEAHLTYEHNGAMYTNKVSVRERTKVGDSTLVTYDVTNPNSYYRGKKKDSWIGILGFDTIFGWVINLLSIGAVYLVIVTVLPDSKKEKSSE